MKAILLFTFLFLFSAYLTAGTGTIIIDYNYKITGNNKPNASRYLKFYENHKQNKPTYKCKIRHDFEIETEKNSHEKCQHSTLYIDKLDTETWGLYYIQRKNNLYKVRVNAQKETYVWVSFPDKKYKINDHEKIRLEQANTFSKYWNGKIYSKPNENSVVILATEKVSPPNYIGMNYRFNKLSEKIINNKTWIKLNQIQYFKDECSSPKSLLEGKIFWIQVKDKNGKLNIDHYYDSSAGCS